MQKKIPSSHKTPIGNPFTPSPLPLEDDAFTFTPNQSNDDSLHSLTLKVFYQTIPGESICVVGSIPELGNWKTHKCHLKWTAGHIWVTEEPIVTSASFFQYKYVLLG